jgi:hypothetical protein
MNQLLAFQFHYDSILDKQVRAKPAVQFYFFVDQWHRLLSDDPEPLQIELIREATFVSRLKQTWTEATMNLDRRSIIRPVS